MVKDGRNVHLMDDSNGVIGLYNLSSTNSILLEVVGSVDYASGRVVIDSLLVDSFTPASGNHVHLYAQPLGKDISVVRNTILKIRDGDVEVSATQVKE